MRTIITIILVTMLQACTLVGPTAPGHASDTWTGYVVQVHDGDTITVIDPERGRIKVRLYGIDTPELGQPYGNRASGYAAKMLLRQEIEGETVAVDRYGRDVALVTIKGADVSGALLKAGLAWVYPNFCRRDVCAEWKAIQEQARSRRKGLWLDPEAIPPWEWRRNPRIIVPEP
ncbi:thermonuclease family protein [Desulfocurvibacter africanus]|uniref:Nuclease (SNase domain-containing protein) n=1 Tax=Desulfocurvibacter africanus subsp. africanus str. Walvis Bay TaxID=690850 RepID=F3YW01_DESAF|nr:thermonuclease family protein [Desulfocurvibacter africanus]EGJ49031.1 nuclease (SNase domain-containing protein) [Desulfocurvibacter africanus subsp. africanus str. Walvis Bay]